MIQICSQTKYVLLEQEIKLQVRFSQKQGTRPQAVSSSNFCYVILSSHFHSLLRKPHLSSFIKLEKSDLLKCFSEKKYIVQNYIQSNLNLVTNLVSVKCVTNSKSVTKFTAKLTTK